MVAPHRGSAAGQSVVRDGVAVILTYFNQADERDSPNGTARFMLVNLTDQSQTVNVVLSVTYNSDFYGDWIRFTETLPARSLLNREVTHDAIRDATFALFNVVFGELEKDISPVRINASHWAPAAKAKIAEEHFANQTIRG